MNLDNKVGIFFRCHLLIQFYSLHNYWYTDLPVIFPANRDLDFAPGQRRRRKTPKRRHVIKIDAQKLRGNASNFCHQVERTRNDFLNNFLFNFFNCLIYYFGHSFKSWNVCWMHSFHNHNLLHNPPPCWCNPLGHDWYIVACMIADYNMLGLIYGFILVLINGFIREVNQY